MWAAALINERFLDYLHKNQLLIISTAVSGFILVDCSAFFCLAQLQKTFVNWSCGLTNFEEEDSFGT